MTTLVFAHANGFPAPTYRRLFEVWRGAGLTVLAPERLGHDPRFPVTDNWPHLRDELIQFIERSAAAPLFLVGHSLGGYLSLLAAARRPDLVRGVVLLDSPLIGPWKSALIRVAKASGLGGRVGPGRVSQRRRAHWADRDAAYAHFAAKPAFARWAAGVLRDYVDAGTEADPAGGVRLRFDRGVETRIYDALPHHVPHVLRRHPLRCPVVYLGGRDSAEAAQVGLAATRRLTRGRLTLLDGSHLFVFEHPLETAAAVLQQIEAMTRGL